MSRFFGIAAAQVMPVINDPDASTKKLEDIAETVVESVPWVDLVCFPELFVSGLHQFVKPTKGIQEEFIQPLSGPLIRRLCKLAQRLHKWLIPGSFFENEGNNVYNSTVVISPEGNITAHYRKLYPWRPLEKVEPGNLGFCVFDIPNIGRFGLCICYDMWFPEVSRSLAWMGAEVILHPSMTSTSDRTAETVMARANAIFNQCYFVDVNTVGLYGGGLSQVIDPDGNVLELAGVNETILIHLLDLDRVYIARELGTMGISQSWKAWRDIPVRYPAYTKPINESPMLEKLGILHYPDNIRVER
jgi:formamidase